MKETQTNIWIDENLYKKLKIKLIKKGISLKTWFTLQAQNEVNDD